MGYNIELYGACPFVPPVQVAGHHTLRLTHTPQQYVSQLATVREDALKEASTRMALVGCGDWKLIENYKSTFESLNQPLPVLTRSALYEQGIVDSKETSMQIQT